MIRTLFALAPVLAVASGVALTSPLAPAAKLPAAPLAPVPVVVELFTSEGFGWSWPPALPRSKLLLAVQFSSVGIVVNALILTAGVRLFEGLLSSDTTTGALQAVLRG